MQSDNIGRTETLAAASRVYSHERPGLVIVVEWDGQSMRAHVFKGKSMGTLFLHAVMGGIRALTGLYEMGLREKTVQIAIRGDGDGA